MLLFKQIKRVLLLVVCFTFYFESLIFAHDGSVITVGYQQGSDFVNDINDIGNEGIGYEILKKIETECSLHFKFKEIDGDIFKALDAGQIDIAGLYFKTPEREEKYVFSENPYNTVVSVLATKGLQNTFYDDPQSINGKKVATYKGNPSNDLFDAYLEKNAISVEYVYGEYTNYLDLEADFYLTFSENKSSLDLYTVLNLNNSHTYIFTTHDKVDLMAEIDAAYTKMKISEGLFYSELIRKYNEDAINVTHRELTRLEVAKLRERPLVVGYVDDHPPFTYTDENGMANGAFIEIMNTFAKKYGFEVTYVPYSLGDSLDTRGQYDIVLSLLGDKEYEAENYVRTENFYKMTMVASVPKSVALSSQTELDLIQKSPRIGIAKYLSVDYDAFMKHLPNNEFVFFNTFTKMLESYKNKELDMAVYTSAGSTYADSYLKASENFLFTADFTLDFYFGVSKKIAEDFVPIFNVMLDTITQREYQSILNIHIKSYYPKETLSSTLEKYWIYFFSFFAIIFLLFLSYDFTVQKQKRDLIIKAYQTDGLTGLMSMSHYTEKVAERLSSAKPSEYELISFDIDYFRTINTYYSMEQGTAVIVGIANGLKTAFANLPILFARKTAEQFYILRKIGEGDSLEDLYYLHILPAIQDIVGKRYKISLSIGSVIIENCEEKISTLMAYSDYARLKGKDRHETTFTIFDKKMKEDFASKLNITYRMDRAISDKEFKVFFQPKVDFNTLKIVGAEALIRWLPPSGGTVYPDEFIEVFERNGFISTLDFYVFKEVCQFMSEWSKEMVVPPISINLSSITILEPFLAIQLSSILSDYGLEPSQIDLEITESAIIGKEATFLSKVQELKEAGFIISIDDFGSGLSSLNRLAVIDADIIKLDKVFFGQKEMTSKNSLIVSEVIALSKKLDMKIVAEGVETYEQAEWLRSLDCDIAQGFYFSVPVDEESFKEQLRTKRIFKMERE